MLVVVPGSAPLLPRPPTHPSAGQDLMDALPDQLPAFHPTAHEAAGTPSHSRTPSGSVPAPATLTVQPMVQAAGQPAASKPSASNPAAPAGLVAVPAAEWEELR